MDFPGAMTQLASLGYKGNADDQDIVLEPYSYKDDLGASEFDDEFNAFLDAQSHAQEEEEEECSNGEGFDQGAWLLGTSAPDFGNFDTSQIDDVCKEGMLQLGEKCSCGPCTKRLLDKDADELAGYHIPDQNHLIVFCMPPSDVDMQVQPSIDPAFLTNTNQQPIFDKDLEIMGSPDPENEYQDMQLPSKRRKIHSERRQPPNPKPPQPEDAVNSMLDVLGPGPFSKDYMARVQQLLIHKLGSNEIQAPTSLRSHQSVVSPVDCQSLAGPSIASTLPRDCTGPSSSVQSLEAFRDNGTTLFHGSLTHNTRQISPDTVVQAPDTTIDHLGQVTYWCTFPDCKYRKISDSKYEWKRHEEASHKQKFMCMECTTGYTHPNGGLACDFCSNAFPDDNALKLHSIRCQDAKNRAQSYPRKDKLREHLRNHHGLTNPIELEAGLIWVFDIDDGWARECGFCGESLSNWDVRAIHVERHFAEGKKKASWRMPFQDQKGKKILYTCNDSSSDDDDDDEDHDDHAGPKGRQQNYRRRGNNSGMPSDSSGKTCRTSDNQASATISDFNQYQVHRMPKNSIISVSRSESSESTITQTCAQIMRGSATAETRGHTPAGISVQRVPPPKSMKSQKKALLQSTYNLERFLQAEEQHERLLLGFGRRPLNVQIGTPQPRPRQIQPQKCLQVAAMNANIATKPTFTPEVTTSKLALQVPTCVAIRKPTVALLKRSPAPEIWEGADSVVDESNMRNLSFSKRLVTLYLSDPQLPYAPGYGNGVARLTSTTKNVPSLPKSVSPASGSTTVTARSSVTSFYTRNASSVSSILSHHPEILWQGLGLLALTTAPFTYGYDLPCEFEILGCQIRFDPAYYEQWICHTASHFMGPLPQKAICLFCDEVSFESEDDTQSNWRRRMLHIRSHLRDFIPWERIRPDFWIMEQLRANNAISTGDYNQAIQYTERPRCEGLKPVGFTTPEQRSEEERKLREDLEVTKEGQGLRKSKIKNLKDVSPSNSISSQNDEPGTPLITINISSHCKSHTSEMQTRKIAAHWQESLETVVSEAITLPAEQASPDPPGVSSVSALDRSDISPIVKSERGRSSRRLDVRGLVIHSANPSIASSVASRSSFYTSSLYSSSSIESNWDKGFPSLPYQYEGQKHRVPDHDEKYITTKYSQDGRVAVTNHQKAGYDKDEPRSSEASSYSRNRKSRVHRTNDSKTPTH